MAGCAVGALLLGVASVSHGQGYSPNFADPTVFTPEETLDGQDGWVTNDTVDYSNYVGIIGGYSSVNGGLDWAYEGGLEETYGNPSTSPVYLYRPFGINGSLSYAFNVNMAISSSQSPYTNVDNFAWTFQNAAGANLFSVDFVNLGGSVDAVRYTTSAGQMSTGDGIALDSIYHLTVAVNSVANTFSITATPSGGSPLTLASNVSLGTASADDVTQIAATWELTHPAAGGSNSLIFNNYSVTVPEPSTWMMLGLGTLGGLVMIRRKARA